MNSIRVLVVDDSAFLRRSLSRMLETEPRIKVIGTAANGQEAVEMAKSLRPDVITLDVLMPVMDGITALRHIVRDTNARVVMISSVTQEGADQTIEALSLGAFDFIAKPSGPTSLDIGKVRSELIHKIITAYEGKTRRPVPGDVAAQKLKRIVSETSAVASAFPDRITISGEWVRNKKELIAIAASTGGPAALQVVLAGLPRDLPAGLVMVQHMSDGFTKALAERLDSVSPLEIKVCATSEMIRPGIGLLAPTGSHLTVKRIHGKLHAILSSYPELTMHRPSADILFRSVAEACGPSGCAVILTGMGNDGAEGMKEIRARGGTTIAQDEATSVVFGMPKAAIEKEGIQIVAPLENISKLILASLS